MRNIRTILSDVQSMNINRRGGACSARDDRLYKEYKTKGENTLNNICLNFASSKGTINKNIYGHFAEHIGGVMYDGLWVGEDSPIENIRGFRKSLVDSFKKLNPPILRWPGGCFAETYDWRDGIGERSSRPTTINWWYSEDKRTESNQVGTHEFMDFCRLVGAEPYFAANITTTTALEIRNWIEYCNFPKSHTTLATLRGTNGDAEPFNVKYWGIGNENWGGGGNMSPQMYAREFMKYSRICDSVNNIDCKFIACGPNGYDTEWTKGFMEECMRSNEHPSSFYAVSLHYYCGTTGHPLEFTEEQYYKQLSQAAEMQTVLDRHNDIVGTYDPERKLKLIVDEWGCWHPNGSGPSNGYNLFEQQSSVRDALVAAMTLNIFNNNCDVVVMANVAQICNNLHSLYLAGADNFVETPNYHVFDMYKTHQDGKMIQVLDDFETIEIKDGQDIKTVSASASVNESGAVTITLANLDYSRDIEVKLTSFGGEVGGNAAVTVLTADDPRACNTFENPTNVVPQTYMRDIKDGDTIVLPKASVVSVVIG